jgi:hypothetical protein
LKRENAPQIKNTMTNKKIAQKNEHAEQIDVEEIEKTYEQER